MVLRHTAFQNITYLCQRFVINQKLSVMKKLMLLLPFVALLMGCASEEKCAQCPVLTVEGGQIVGVEAEIPGVFAYKGIPYAAAPIGDLRGKA